MFEKIIEGTFEVCPRDHRTGVSRSRIDGPRNPEYPPCVLGHRRVDIDPCVQYLICQGSLLFDEVHLPCIGVRNDLPWFVFEHDVKSFTPAEGDVLEIISFLRHVCEQLQGLVTCILNVPPEKRGPVDVIGNIMGKDDSGIKETGTRLFRPGGENDGIEPGRGGVVDMEGGKALQPLLKVARVPDDILDLKKAAIGEDHPEVTSIEVGDHREVRGMIEIESA